MSLSDAQMGMCRVIRPFKGFEAVYQGRGGDIPIAFPGTLDPQAGKNGISASLMSGIPTPLGSRILLQIPMTADTDSEDITSIEDRYEYQFMWRTRNQSWFTAALLDGRQASSYHLKSETVGRNQLIFIPGASDIEAFEQDAPAAGAATVNLLQQRYRPQITVPWVEPLLPSGDTGAWQQGVYGTAGQAGGPTWAPLWIDACGDELLILAYKINADEPWDFTSAADDRAFSNTYGSNNGSLPNMPNIGILISTGTMG
jgi:hypothetical protein